MLSGAARLAMLVSMGASACAPGEITTFASGTDADAPGAADAPTPADARTVAPDARAAPDASTADGPTGGPGPLLGTFRLTYYYVAAESDYTDSGDDTTLYTPSCAVLATVPTAFADAVVIEGTGQLDGGEVFNYTGSCPCAFSPCFELVDAGHPWGTGASDRALVPFRSIAVDRSVLTIGKHYYVAELDGVTMPGEPPTGGFVHDGCVSADDTGGDIIGMHIDFFSALRSYYLTLDRALALDDITLHEGGDRCP
jgi:3D (Asp-Asp-Asp) domain-containing protein